MLETMSYGIERLFGALLYVLMLMIFFALIYVSGDRKKAFSLINVYLLVLVAMSFFFVPSESTDLTRLRALYDVYWVGKSFPTFVSKTLLKSACPIAYLLIYLCQSTGIEGLLPAVTAFIFYALVFDILKKSVAYYSADTKQIAITMLYIMSTSNLIAVIGGVRSGLAFAIVAKAFSDEVFSKKSFVSRLPIYVIACLIHNAAFPVVGIIFVVYLFESKKLTTNKKIVIMITLVIVALGAVVGSSFLQLALNKLVRYMGDGVYFDLKIYGGSFVSFAMLLLIFIFANRVANKSIVSNKYKRAIVLLLVFDFVFAFNFVIFARYLMVVEILMVPTFVCLLTNSKDKVMVRNNLFLVSLLFLALAYLAGDLSAYKFFVR